MDDRIRAQYNAVMNGQRLADKQRNDFVSRAGMLYNQALEGYDRTAEEFRRIAAGTNLDPDLVIFDRANMRGYKPAQAPVSDELQEGAVVDGYRWNGGPKDQESSWVKI